MKPLVEVDPYSFQVVDARSGWSRHCPRPRGRTTPPALPYGIPVPYKDTWTHDLQLADGGRELCVTDDIHDLIRVVRLADMTELAQIRTGH